VTFQRGVEARSELSWRAVARRTTARIRGEYGTLELDGDQVRLFNASGGSEDVVVRSDPDDSYHAAWFSGVAAEFARAIAEGPGGPTASRNLAEARVAVNIIAAARESSRSRKPVEIKL